MKSCGPCSLKTGCYLVALYTFILAVILLVFNANDLVSYGTYGYQWSRVTSIVVAVCLFFAGICLFLGLRNNNNSLLHTWFIIFLIYVILQLCNIIWNIVMYLDHNNGYNDGYRTSVLSNIIIFALLMTLNFLCLVAVRSQSGGSGGGIV